MLPPRWSHWLRFPGRRPAAPQRAVFEELEPRLLYSADSPGAWLASAVQPSAVVQVVSPVLLSTTANTAPTPSSVAQAVSPTQRREIVFVDAAVPDAQTLIDSLRAQRPADAEIEIVAIRSDADALSQINAVLQGQRGVDAVHIISHGDAGRLWLGNGLIDESTLLARQDEWGAWHGALAPDADLLLWGCDVAAGPLGQSFIARWAQLTGADVAASTDATGARSLGGDWLLEARTGEVAEQAALGAAFQLQYAGVLPSYQQFTHYTGPSEITSAAHWGQTFTHTSGGGSYSVNEISLALKRDAGAPAQIITVELRSSWNGGVLGSATVDAAVLGTSFAMVDLSFSGMLLTDGTAYTMRINSDSPTGGVYLGTNPSGGYAGGTKLDVNGAVLAGEDLAFKVASIQSPTVDASSSVATDGVASVNLPHTTAGSNRLMLVSVATDPHGERVSAVTYNGINLGRVGVEELGGNHSRVEIWSLVAPSTGLHNVVVKMTGTGYNGLAVGVTTYTGVNQAAPLLDFNGASGSSTAAAVTVASAPHDVVFAAVHSHNGTGVLPGAGQTEFWDVINAQSNGAASGQAGASLVTGSWTVDNGDWSAAAVSIQADSHSTATLSTTAVKDAYIEAMNPTSNRGLLASMVVDRETGDLQRALVQFDLSALPANAVIVSAALKFEASTIDGALNLSAHQLQQSWTETGVTWNESSPGVNWSVAGGAYNATALDTLNTAATGQHQWDVTSLAQAWVAGTQPNQGVMIASADGGGNRTVIYNSREGAAAPVFDIVYFIPNTAPLATNLSAAETYTEDTAQNLAAIVITDPDSANIITATLTLSSSAAGGLNTGTAGGVTSTYNAGTGEWSASGALADVNTLLAALTFTPAAHYDGNFSIATSVSDGVALAASGSKAMTGTAVNDAPQITTTGGTVTYTENGVPLALDTGLAVSDVDNSNLANATVTISANFAAGQDVLAFSDQNGISGSFNAGTGVLTLSGSASVASYQTALRSVTYLNSSEAPNTSLRTFSFDVSDGALTSAVATRSLQVNAVNDAPVLDNTASMVLSTIARNNNTSDGDTVAQIIGSVGGDRITDVDAASVEGVALTDSSTGGIGLWQFSLDGGSSWAAVAAVNVNSALLLRDTDLLRFVPSGAANGQATLTFRAWDQTAGTAGTRADASSGGDANPYSAAFETATLNVVENTNSPTAVADTAQTPVVTPAVVNVLANDLDPQGDPLRVLDISNPANGGASDSGGGTITYTPNPGFSGNDSFNYLISDGNEGLTHYWKLDGNATDSVGAAHGTLVNGPSTVAGVYGNALQFDGANDHVVLPDFNYSNAFTLSFRFLVDNNAGSEYQYFYSHGALPTSNSGNMVHVALGEASHSNAANRNQILTSVFDGNEQADGAGQLRTDVASLIGDGLWHQYTLTVTPGIGVRVYIDGTLRGSVNRGGDASNPAGDAMLGARSDLEPTRYLNAGSRMDSVAVFNRALSGAEVGGFYNGGSSLGGVTVNVNAAPVVNTSGGNASYTENAAATVLDAGLTVSDANSATLAGATVSISSNYMPGQDQLLFNDQLGISGSWNVGTGTLTLSGTATVADYQTALRSVGYVNSSEAPGTALRGLTFIVNDGLVASATAARNLTVTAVNDAPAASNLFAAETTTEDTALNLTDIVASDVDSANVSATLTLSNPAAGALATGTAGAVTSSYNAATGVWAASGALADVNTLLASLVFTPTADFNGNFVLATRVDDGVAAAITGNKSFTGVPVNDAPTASNLNAAESYTEDLALNLADIVAADIDSSSGSVTLVLLNPSAGLLGTGSSGAVSSSYNPATGVWTASGAFADINVLLAALSFTPTPDFNGAFSISTRVSDGTAAPITGSKNFTGVAVNDAPTATQLNTSETTAEDQPLDLADLAISDIDSATVSARLTLSNPAAGAFSVASAGSVTASYNAATGTWLASGALADVNSLLAGLLFTPAPDFNGMLTVTTQVDDGVAAALPGSKSLTVMPVNDAPTASNLSSAETYTEDTVLNLADIVISDVDHSTGSATLTLSDPAAGVLSSGSSGAVNASYNAATGVWQASGALVDVNALLAALSFTPAANASAAFSITTRISDGVAAPVAGSKMFSGVAVNNAPTATNLDAAEATIEDVPLDLTDIVVSDLDSANISARLTLSSVAAGALSTATSGMVTSSFNPATGVWSASGALADVNALLAAVAYLPAANFNANFSINTAVDDGAAPALIGSKLFTATAVNDAPTASGLNTPELYTEDTALALANLLLADIDSAALQVTLTLSNTAAGTLSTPSAGGVTAAFDAATGRWTASGLTADVNAVLAAVQFTPALNFNGSFSVATAVTDGQAAPVAGRKNFTGVAVNDAPVLAPVGSLLVAEGGATTLGAAQLQATDVDHAGQQLIYTVLAAPARGTLSLDGAALAAGGVFTQAELDGGRVAYRHDGSETTADAFGFSLSDGQATAATGAGGALVITVLAVNDEVPQITSPAAGLLLTVPENMQAVTRASATDADLPVQTLRYELGNGGDAAFFSIDSSTGEVQFIQAPDFETPLDADGDNVYRFDLRVSDGAWASTRAVVVTVLPDNDNAPQFVSGGGGAQAAVELQEGNTGVTTVRALDADRPAQNLSYAIVGGADAARFALDATSGALRFVDAPMAIAPRDNDRDNRYDVVVQASDGSRVVQQALRVQVRAALAAGVPSSPFTPPPSDASAAPAAYTGGEKVTDAAAPQALSWPDLQPLVQAEEEAASWATPWAARRGAVARLVDGASSRATDGGPAAAFVLVGAAAQESNLVEGGHAQIQGADTQSLEAALGLPTVDPGLMQVRPGGLSLAALAAQTAARSSTAVPGQLLPAQMQDENGHRDDDADWAIEALAAPVVAGGVAFSATLLVWATRAGGLAAAMMASVPAWRSLDPLPILERADEPDDDDPAGPLLPAPNTGAGAADDLPLHETGPAEADPHQAPTRKLLEPLEMLR